MFDINSIKVINLIVPTLFLWNI